MKKVVLSFLLAFSVTLAVAQNYNNITLLYTTGKFEDARKEIDKISNDPKTKDKPETYIWKLNILSELYADSVLKSKYPTAAQDAMQTLDLYVAKEPTLKVLKDNGMRAVSLLYGQSFNYGRTAFQNKDWENSFNSFTLCRRVSEFIGKNGLNTNGKYTIDTTVVLYNAYAAQNAGKSADAAVLYKSLADWKIADKDFEDSYKFILDYDTKQKDEASFEKYLVLAKAGFPEDAALWSQFEMGYMTINSSLLDIVKKYKAEDAAGTLKEDEYRGYAESFASPEKAQLAQLDSTQQDELKHAAANAFEKAFNYNKNGLYAFNAGVLYYSIFGALDDRYYGLRGESADLKLKRDAVVKDQQEVGSKAIEWLEKAYNILKVKEPREKTESSSLNRSVDYLANLYVWKRDKSRGTNVKDYDALDLKYKQFDGEHDKYKESPNKSVANTTNSDDNSKSQKQSIDYISGKGSVPMVKKNGVYVVKCKVNDELNWDMIFDTGASNVSISLTEATYMLKQGLLKPNEILNKQLYQTADGTISEGYTILLKKIQIGSIILYNVRASVANSLNAPLLLGQSALQNFTTITIDTKNSLLIIK